MLLYTDISLNDLAAQISNSCLPDEIMQFIKILDLYVAEYTFTKDLFEYLRKELIIEDKQEELSKEGIYKDV